MTHLINTSTFNTAVCTTIHTTNRRINIMQPSQKRKGWFTILGRLTMYSVGIQYYYLGWRHIRKRSYFKINMIIYLHIKILMWHTTKKGNSRFKVILPIPSFSRLFIAVNRATSPSLRRDITGRSETAFRSAARRYLFSFFMVSAVIPKKMNNHYIVSLQL